MGRCAPAILPGHAVGQMPILSRPIRAASLGVSLLAVSLLGPLLTGSMAGAVAKPLRFVLVPKLAHPWFETVREGAEAAALMINRQTKNPAVVEYRPPARSELALQAAILEAVIRSRPSGISIDLLDAEGLRPLLEQARRQGIAVNVFDSEPPAS